LRQSGLYIDLMHFIKSHLRREMLQLQSSLLFNGGGNRQPLHNEGQFDEYKSLNFFQRVYTLMAMKKTLSM